MGAKMWSEIDLMGKTEEDLIFVPTPFEGGGGMK